MTARPGVVRLLVESREPVGQADGPLERWRLVHRTLESTIYDLERAGKTMARDPELTGQQPRGVGELTTWDAVTEILGQVAMALAGLVPRPAQPRTQAAIRAAIIPKPTQFIDRWEQQATAREELASRGAAVLRGERWELYLVAGCEALTPAAVGIVGVPNPGSIAGSNPEAYFRPLHGSIGGPFDRDEMLHWAAVLWNAARVRPDAPNYLSAQATKREAVVTLAYLERERGETLADVLELEASQ